MPLGDTDHHTGAQVVRRDGPSLSEGSHSSGARGCGEPASRLVLADECILACGFARYYGLIDRPIGFGSSRDLAFILCDKFDARQK
jgi:hypothetical protein